MSGALSAPLAAGALWYLDRATGVVTLVLFTAVLVLGVLTRGGSAPLQLPRFVVAGLHRNLALLATSLLAVHIATSVLDSFAPIRLVDAFVPFVSAYRPLWLGLGAFALDLLVAVLLTSLLRLRMGLRAWRAVHLTTWLAWPVAVVHGLGTGSDARAPWMLAVTAVCVGAVVVSALWRVLGVATMPVARRAATAVGVVAAPAVLALWAVSGPLAPGWAARSGTPAAQLAAGATATAGNVSAPRGGDSSQQTVVRPAGTARIVGTVSTRQGGDEQVTIELAGRLRGGPGGQLVIDLTGEAGDGGGVRLRTGSVTLSSSDGSRWQGPVDGLSGGSVQATLQGPGATVRCTADVRVDPSTNKLLGTVTFA